jgi:hypothetical protein
MKVLQITEPDVLKSRAFNLEFETTRTFIVLNSTC